MKVFDIQAYRSEEGRHDWCAFNDELPVAAEARTFDALLAEIRIQAAEMAELNQLVKHGERIHLRIIETTDVFAAA